MIGVAAFVRFAFAGGRNFEVTALDMLVVFVAVVVPLLPAPVRLPAMLTSGIAKTMLLLYAVELLLGGGLRTRVPHAILVLTFSAIAVRGLITVGA